MMTFLDDDDDYEDDTMIFIYLHRPEYLLKMESSVVRVFAAKKIYIWSPSLFLMFVIF